MVRRRRAVFAVFVLLSVVLVTASFGGSGTLGALESGVQAVLSPIESGASIALKPFRDAIGWIGDTFSAQGENDELRAEVQELRQKLAEQQDRFQNAKELRAIERLDQVQGYPSGLEAVEARVIAQSPTSWYATVQIDKGRGDGVEVDDPVVTGGGLAGKVTDLTGGTATVTLITDADSAVSAQVLPSGARGVVKPQVGNPEDLLLDFLEEGDKVDEGDTVITSGTTSNRFESLFPPGIPIGKVSRIDTGERELYQRVHMRPFAELRDVEFVEVLTGGSGVQSAQAP